MIKTARSIRSILFDEKKNGILGETEIFHIRGLQEDMIKECPPFWKDSNLVKLYDSRTIMPGLNHDERYSISRCLG